MNREGLKKLYRIVRNYLGNWCTWIFFEVPIRKGRSRGIEYHRLRIAYYRLKILFLVVGGVPYALLAVWFILVPGCSIPVTRHQLGHFCIEPFENNKPRRHSTSTCGIPQARLAIYQGYLYLLKLKTSKQVQCTSAIQNSLCFNNGQG